jgi:fibronectin-binding autotransporter adhesin
MANALNKDFIVKNGLIVQAVGAYQSTSTTTGAIVTPGGLGIGGNANIAGGIIAGGIDLLAYDSSVHYVSDNIGSDSNDGHRPQSPFKSIKYALSQASSGDTIYIESGTYTEIFPLTVPEGVSVRGAGIREVLIQPTVATKTNDAFYLGGDTTLSDFTVANFFQPGYAFKFKSGTKITRRSPYIERVTVLTLGSTQTASDPYGFASADAGGGAYLDASTLTSDSLEPGMLFNEFTALVPHATGVYMTNGARAEIINGFFYFANKAIEAVAGPSGFAGSGKTKIRLGGISGSFTAGDTLNYYSSTGTLLVSATISSVDSSYIYFNGPVYGFQTAADLGTSTQVVFSTGINPSTATSILLADYHQFGAEIRSIGSAAVYGNYGIVANGTGTEIKLIAFNVSHIGSGGDLTNDITKTVQANEIVQQNNGKIYFQTVDQSGDFRVGSQFLINQRTGNVNFGTATINLASLPSLDITDGTNNTYITPTSITVGDLTFSGSTVASASGNLTFSSGGGNIALSNSTYVQGTLTATNTIKSSSTVNATGTNTGAIQSAGGIGVAKDLYVGGNINVLGIVTTTNLAAFNAGITALTATNFTATSVNISGQELVASSLITRLTATIFTSPNATISNLSFTTGTVTTLTVTSNTNTNSTLTGALVVSGGAAVGLDLFVGGSAYIGGDLYIDGQQTIINTTQIQSGDKLLVLSSGTTLAASAVNSGIQIGTGSGFASILYDGAGSWKVRGGLLPNGTMNIGSLANSWNNIYGNAIFDNQNRVITSVTPSAGLGIAITALASGGPSASFQVTNTGVLSVIAGTDTNVSSATGNVTIWNIATLQSVTGRGSSTNQNIQLTNNQPASSQTTGTLVVTGGVGIGGALYAGNMYSNGAAVWTTATLTNNNQLTNGANYLTSSTLGQYGVAAVSAGAGISISTATGVVTVTNIGVISLAGSNYIGVSASSGSVILTNLGVQQITTGSGIAVTTSTGTVNIASIDTLQLVTARGNTTNQTISITANNLSANTNSGQALLVSGGVGALAVYAINLFDNGNRALTSVTPVGGNAIGISAVSTSGPNTTFTINNQGVTSAVGTTYIGVSASTGSVTFTNLGVQTLTAGTDTAVSASTGTVTFWTTSTLQSVTARGATTNQAITITNGTNAGSTNTGALIVSGGVGINQDLYIGGNITIVGTVNASTVVGSISTSTNLFGGALGSIPYQTAAGRTSFIGIGSAGNLLQSNGTTATWVSTTSLYVNYATNSINAINLNGGYVNATTGIFSGITTVTNTTPATSTSTGALQVAGGVGVGGSVVANQLYENLNRVVTQVSPSAGTAIGISNLVSTGPTVSFAITNLGVTATVGTTYLGVSATTGTVVFTNLGVQTVTAGTDTAVSNSTGTITIWNTATLQGVTGRGSTTNQAISITNTASSNTSTSGALTVSGGVGIGQNLNVGGSVNIQGGATFGGSVTFNGTATYVFSTNTVYTDNLIELHAQSTGTLFDWTYDDGKDIGLRFHYYNRSLATGTSAALVLADDTQWLEWYASGAESGNIFTSSNYGSFRLGAIQLVNLTNSISTTTGSLTVAGGVGIGKDLTVGGNVYASGSQVITAATLGSFGVSQILAGPYISVSPAAGTGTVTVGNLGVQYIASGSGIAVSTSTGTVIIASVDTLQLVTSRGSTSSQAISITSSTASTSTATGALTVAGGVGIGGALYVQLPSTFYGAITGSITTASNIAGGSIGQIPIQSGAGTTSFIPGGITGQLLQFVSNTASWVTTTTLYVGNSIYAVTATNLAFGTSGQLPYQNAVGQTSFTGGAGSAGNVLVSNGSSAPSFNNTLTLAGTTSATSTNSGAFQVAGGAGIGGALYAGGNIYSNGNLVITQANLGQFGVAQILAGPNISVSPGAGTGTVTIGNLGVTATIGTTYLGVSATTGSVTFTNLGVQTVTGSAYLGVSASTGTVVLYNSGVQTLSAGTDTAVSSNTGTVTVWTTSTLQSVTNRGATTNQAISITNATASSSTATGALIVSGGAGFGGNIFGGGSLNIAGLSTITGASVHIGAGYFDSSVGIKGNLVVTGTSVLNGSSTVNGALSVGGNFNVTGTTLITNTTNAGSTNTGALQVAGGVGVGGNLYAGGLIYASGSQVITAATLGAYGVSQIVAGNNISVSPASGTGTVTVGNLGVTATIGTTYLGVSATTGSVTFTNLGVQTVSGSAYLGVSASTGTVTLYNSGVQTVTGSTYLGVSANTGTVVLYNLGVQYITTGSGIAVTTSTGTVNIASIDTLQLVTARGSTTNQAISITNTTAASNTQSGALQVAGGVGIGGSLYVGGGAYLGGDLYVDGTQFVVNSVTISSGDKTLTLSTSASSAALALGSGLQIGPLASPYITWLYDGSGGWTSSGAIKSTNTLTVLSVVNASSTLTGGLIVSGGAGIGGNLYAGGSIYSNGNLVLTQTNLGQYGVTQILAGQNISVSPAAGTGTVTIGNLGVTATIGTTYLGVSATTGSVTFTNLGVQTLTAGTDTAVSASTGTITVWTTSTLQSVTNRGATTTNAINIANATASGSTNTGALQVQGGVGIGGGIFVGGTVTATNFYGTVTTVNITTYPGSTNLNIAPNGTGSVLFTASSQIYVYNTTQTTSTNSGALQIVGGLGVGQNIYAGGNLNIAGTGYVNSDLGVRGNIIVTGTSVLNGNSTHNGTLGVGGNFNVTGTTVLAGLTTVANGTNASSTNTGAFQVAGGVGVGGNLYAGGTIFSGGAQVVTAATLGVFGVTQIQAGPYISVSPASGTGTVTVGNLGVQYITTGSGITVTTSTGTVNIASIDTLQLVTNRGFTTTNQINITNATAGLTTNTNQALLISGGIGALLISATAIYDNSNRVLTNVQPSAGTGINITSLTTSAGTVAFTVSNTGVLSAVGTTYLGVSQATGNVTFTNLGVQTLSAGTDTAVSASTGTITVWSTATLQSITNRANSTTNAIYITNNTIGTSTTTGALTVGGTIGALGIYVGGTTSTFASNVILTTSTQATSSTNGALVVAGGVGVGGNLYVGGTMYAGGAQVVTAVTLGAFGVSQILAGPYISVSPAAGTGTVTVGNLGVQTLTAGTDTAVSSTTGTVVVWSTATLQGVTGRGATTNQAISITNTTTSTNTQTGALTVAGGVGVGDSLYVGNRVGFGSGGIGKVYQFYNAATNSLDTVFG